LVLKPAPAVDVATAYPKFPTPTTPGGVESDREETRMASTSKQDWIVQGIPTRVLSAGGGPALVFLHGTGGSGKVWFNQLRRFEPDYRVLAPDLPGYGQTPLPEGIRSIDDYPGFILSLLDEAGLAEAVLIGNSMGGRVALQLALDHPERVSGLVLVNASGLSLPEFPIFHARDAAPEEFAARLYYRASSRGDIAERFVQSPEQVRARQTMLRLTAGPLRHDMQDRLGEVQAPTLVIWGEGDRIIPPAYADAFVAGIPNATLAMIARAGHVPMLERPGAVNEAIARFLAEHPQGVTP
jgi:4,5:9,10-diseco-3-hydroxy-5,9,17-trioxoandrosta-1(10),2-diene-4-oate hydrolase